MTQRRQGHTKPVLGEESAPRMPHERDESSDSQLEEDPRPVMRQAHQDIVEGRVDTDRGPPMDETYQRQKEERSPRKQRG